MSELLSSQQEQHHLRLFWQDSPSNHPIRLDKRIQNNESLNRDSNSANTSHGRSTAHSSIPIIKSTTELVWDILVEKR